MNCRHCGSHLLETDSLCFYFQNEHSISLIVKQEQYVILLKKFKQETQSRKTNICCPNCSNGVGKCIPCGPNGTTYMAFGNEKVVLLNIELDKKKQPWSTVYNLTSRMFEPIGVAVLLTPLIMSNIICWSHWLTLECTKPMLTMFNRIIEMSSFIS